MKNPNERKEFAFFQLNECDAIKEYLEEMALKGWKLKYYRTYYCFEKIEPQKLIYSVEVFSKASIYDTVPANSTHEYIDYCKEAGWSFVCNIGQINIFVANSQNAIPIETDERLKFETIKRGIIKQNAITWFGVLPMFTLNLVLKFTNFESLFSSNLSLFYILAYMMIITLTIIQVISFTVWAIKQSKNLKAGNPIQYISKSGRKKRTILLLIPSFLMTLLLLVFAIFSLTQSDYFTAIMMGFVILLFPLMLLFSHFLQKKGLSRTANKVIPVLLGFGISILIFFIAIFSILLPDTDSSPHGNPSYSSKTFLASTATYEYVTESNEEISVTIFKSNYTPIIKQYLHATTRYHYVPISLPEWDAETSYVAGSNYCIVFDTYVISFYCGKPLTEDDIAKIKAFV